MSYVCSVDGEETVLFGYRDGSSDLMPNGRSCDYEQWREEVRLYGRVQTRGRLPDFGEWLAVRKGPDTWCR